ncbi:predicted protein [Micromonas commoda]|uniref:Uncharacterized protein n=1 Tax=Micromonas commoda (strain RCC299 / NOUM17 / CCMP2709) TaxID=296587 RepID=C1E739_MICCC|nr:predicted protein [Micromonas commoda]ACO63914.1 predicted protein [Micromonas commoda]|eukprot:XP_002502656.1 predicted protein [Micromonas commoda]
MPSSAFAGGDAGRRPLRELQRSADGHRPAARRRDARVKASAKDDDAAPARALEDPALRSSLQGLAERILAEAPSRDDDDDDNDGENDDDDAGGDANLRGETGDVEATSRKKMADHALAYAVANSTAVNARGAVLAGRVGRIARSTAASRARSRSATPSPERGGRRPGWRPNGAPRDDDDDKRLGRHRRGRRGGSGRRASPEVRACAEATDRLVAAVTRQRAATAARGLVFEDASAEATEGADDDAPSCVSSLSESEDGEIDDGVDGSVRGILRGFADAATTMPDPSEPSPDSSVRLDATQQLHATSLDPPTCDDAYLAAKSFADELRGVSASAARVVAERLGRCEHDRAQLARHLEETKRRLETAVSFAAEVRDVCAAKDEAIAAKEAELAEARAALAAAAARTLASSLLPSKPVTTNREEEAPPGEETNSSPGDSNSKAALTLTPAATYAADLEEELRATRAAHAEERTALERTMAAKDEANAESTARMEKERERARAALRDAEMELQEALGDVTRLRRALSESKDANKSAEDVAAAESKMVDELRGRCRELEDEKGVLEARLRTATAEANGEADARADASADKRAAREDLAVLKGSLDSLRAELDGERAVAQKAERARAEVNGRLFQLTAEADGLRRRLASAKEECEAQRRSAEAARCLAKTAKKEEAPLREELAAVKENGEELVAELAATRLQLAASERSRKASQKALTEKDEECAGAKADALRLDDEVKRLESELAKVGVAEKIREREALRALQEREWERGEANADHARVLRDATTRAEDAERECQSLRKRSEEAEARADAAENRTRDVETRIEHLERSAKDSARASKGSSLTAEINSALRQELEELGLELATAREETEARLAERDRVRADLKVQNEEFAKLEAALGRAEARAGDAEAAHAASARTVDSLRTELTQMARKIAELELAAEAAFVERSNLARNTEALERELAEVKTAKETLEGETWALREELAEATIVRLERAAAGGSDVSPAAGDASADVADDAASADVADDVASADVVDDVAVEAPEAKKGRPAPRTPILADGRSSVSSLSFSVSGTSPIASGTYPVTPAEDVTAAMAATAAAREETANAEAQLEQIAEALVRAEVSLSERDARCEDLRREVDVANGKAAAAEHRAAVAERGASAARAELGLALERVAKERTRAAAAESQLSSAKRLLAEASSASRRAPGDSPPGAEAGSPTAPQTTPATPNDELALRQRLRESVYEIELLRAKVRVMEAKAEVGGREGLAEDASFEGGDGASFDGDDGGDVSFEGGECAEARASSSSTTPSEVSPMSRALGLSVTGETTPTLSADATTQPATTQPSPATPAVSESDDGSGSSFHGFTDPKLKRMLQEEEDGTMSPYVFPGWRRDGERDASS